MTTDFKKIFGESKVKKISLNIGDETLKMIDEFAELSKTNRTVVLNAMFVPGLRHQIKTSLSIWKRLAKDKKYERKKKKIEELIKLTKAFQKKYHLDKEHNPLDYT